MKILVTGSSGFLGINVLMAFRKKGHEVFPLPSFICDLRNLEEARETFWRVKPDLIVHSAAMCGGIGFNSPRQAEMFLTNAQITLSLFEAARIAKVPRIISICSSCAYPDIDKDLSEIDLWLGQPHPSALGYGMSKRFQIHVGFLYKLQYGMDVISVIFPNVYGIHDRFEPERSHVVAALIKKIVEAKRDGLPEVEVWGSGMAQRELLYVKDATEALLLLSEKGCACELPINIGTGRGEQIRDVALAVKQAVGYEGRLVFNIDKPEGPRRKVMDVTRMKNLLGWSPPTSLQEGIQKTVEWYLSSKEVTP